MRMVATQKFKKEKTLTTTKKFCTHSYFSCVYVGFSSNKRQRIKKLFYFDFVSLYKCKQHFFSSKTQHKGKKIILFLFFTGSQFIILITSAQKHTIHRSVCPLLTNSIFGISSCFFVRTFCSGFLTVTFKFCSDFSLTKKFSFLFMNMFH